MSAACQFCDDTGSLSKQLIGYLDCTHCDVAGKRVVFEHWAVKNAPGCDDLNVAWVIYRHGVAQPDFGASKPFQYRSTAQCVLRNELAIIIGCQDGRSGQDKADAVLRWIEKN